MLKANRVLQYRHTFLSLFLLLFLSASFPAQAIENTIPMSEKDSILNPTLEKGGKGI